MEIITTLSSAVIQLPLSAEY